MLPSPLALLNYSELKRATFPGFSHSGMGLRCGRCRVSAERPKSIMFTFRSASRFKHVTACPIFCESAIGRALNIRERIDRFFRTHKPDRDSKYKPQQDKLTSDDWRFLERLHDTLDAFFFSTKTTEGYEPLLDDWFKTMHFLLNEVDAWKQEAEAEGDRYLATFLTAAWNKIEKYYKLADSALAYYAAIVLNPSLKMHWFREQWSTENTALWIPQTEERVRHI